MTRLTWIYLTVVAACKPITQANSKAFQMNAQVQQQTATNTAQCLAGGYQSCVVNFRDEQYAIRPIGFGVFNRWKLVRLKDNQETKIGDVGFYEPKGLYNFNDQLLLIWFNNGDLYYQAKYLGTDSVHIVNWTSKSEGAIAFYHAGAVTLQDNKLHITAEDNRRFYSDAPAYPYESAHPVNPFFNPIKVSASPQLLLSCQSDCFLPEEEKQ